MCAWLTLLQVVSEIAVTVPTWGLSLQGFYEQNIRNIRGNTVEGPNFGIMAL